MYQNHLITEPRGKILVFLLAFALIACTMFVGSPELATAGGGHNDTLAIKDSTSEIPPPGGAQPAPDLDVIEFLWLLLSAM